MIEENYFIYESFFTRRDNIFSWADLCDLREPCLIAYQQQIGCVLCVYVPCAWPR